MISCQHSFRPPALTIGCTLEGAEVTLMGRHSVYLKVFHHRGLVPAGSAPDCQDTILEAVLSINVAHVPLSPTYLGAYLTYHPAASSEHMDNIM